MKLTDIKIKPTVPDRLVFQTYFPEYLVRRPGGFEDDVAEQELRVETLIHGMGLGSNGMKVLEGLAPTVPVSRHWIGLLKAPAVADAVKAMLDDGIEKVTVLGCHIAALNDIRERLRDYGAVCVWPGTNPRRRERWQRDYSLPGSRLRVMCASMTAAAGLSCLGVTNRICVAEWDWSPDVNMKALVRARAKQTHELDVRCFVLEGSYDATVMPRLRQHTAKKIADYDVFLR